MLNSRGHACRWHRLRGPSGQSGHPGRPVAERSRPSRIVLFSMASDLHHRGATGQARANHSLASCVTVAVCNAALCRPSDSEIAGSADRQISAGRNRTGRAVCRAQNVPFWLMPRSVAAGADVSSRALQAARRTWRSLVQDWVAAGPAQAECHTLRVMPGDHRAPWTLAGEKETLVDFLDYLRGAVIRKASGLPAAAVRRPMVGSARACWD